MAQASTYQKPVMFVHTVTAAEGSADTLDIQVLPDEMIGINTDDFIFIVKLLTSAGVERATPTATYSKTTGKLTVAHASMDTADIVTVAGVFGTIA